MSISSTASATKIDVAMYKEEFQKAKQKSRKG